MDPVLWIGDIVQIVFLKTELFIHTTSTRHIQIEEKT